MQCPKCETELPDGAKFCLECGTNLQVATSASECPSEVIKTRLVPEPERKHVTALFSDLTGCTSMTKRLDLEQIQRNVDGCFRIPMYDIRFDWAAHWLDDKSKRGESQAYLH
jgi:hypothetical protein